MDGLGKEEGTEIEGRNKREGDYAVASLGMDGPQADTRTQNKLI
jgi:hypothetical protein